MAIEPNKERISQTNVHEIDFIVVTVCIIKIESGYSYQHVC